VPVSKVVTNAGLEIFYPFGDFVFRYWNRRHVEVAEVNTEVDSLSGWNHQMPGIVLAQTFHREFATNGFEWFKHGWPVLGVAEPELFIFLLFECILKDEVVRVNIFPALGTFRNR